MARRNGDCRRGEKKLNLAFLSQKICIPQNSHYKNYVTLRERIRKLELDLENQTKANNERFNRLDEAIRDLSLKYDEIMKTNQFIVRNLNSSHRRAA